jgi:hypothetical protein
MAIVVGLVAVDLLGRIFCLSDVTNNSENFGFAGRQVCIVDFLTKTKTYYQEEYLWEGFLRGSSRYVYSHALTRYVLASRTELERVKVAVRVWQERFTTLESAVTEAQTDLQRIIEDLRLPESALEDFSQYTSDVLKNISLFQNKLNLYCQKMLSEGLVLKQVGEDIQSVLD